jgi:hypothetical protein
MLLLIRSITATTWGHEAWPEVKPVFRRALEMRRQIARGGLGELDSQGRRSVLLSTPPDAAPGRTRGDVFRLRDVGRGEHGRLRGNALFRRHVCRH